MTTINGLLTDMVRSAGLHVASDLSPLRSISQNRKCSCRDVQIDARCASKREIQLEVNK